MRFLLIFMSLLPIYAVKAAPVAVPTWYQNPEDPVDGILQLAAKQNCEALLDYLHFGSFYGSDSILFTGKEDSETQESAAERLVDLAFVEFVDEGNIDGIRFLVSCTKMDLSRRSPLRVFEKLVTSYCYQTTEEARIEIALIFLQDEHVIRYFAGNSEQLWDLAYLGPYKRINLILEDAARTIPTFAYGDSRARQRYSQSHPITPVASEEAK